MNRRVSIAASAIVRHVLNGGYLGASWPLYINLRGASANKAMEVARQRFFRRANEPLSIAASRNFMLACEEAAAMEESYSF